ncbi:MAG: NAD-dependent epimerase/dehydratase family protein, partial [Planctomycetes bacterium]|nr:NAD-dependent epimerase/dehydratase family protein [Planctomycetota bacterium]
FIGSHLVNAFATPEASVVVLDNLSSGSRDNLPNDGRDVRFLEGDLRDREAVRAAVTGVDVVLHLAALVSVQASIADPVGSAEINIGGTSLVLEEGRRAGVRRIVFASSAAVYGEPESVPIAETHPQRPISPYGIHKLAGEHMARVSALTGGPDAVSFRFFNVYGSRQRHDSDYAAVIPIFRASARRDKSPQIFGDGEQTRDFIHVGDVVEAIRRAVAAPHPWRGEVFNLARGEATTINALARLVLAQEQCRRTPEYGPPRMGDIAHSVASIAKLERAFQWTPPTPLAQGLRHA